MAETIFLDVNVFMYAAGAPHPYKGPCLRILTDVEIGVLPAVINAEILQELLYRYSHIGMADKGIQLCREILNYPLTILPVTEPDVRLAIDLLDAYRARGLKPRDAIHAATMQHHGITRLLSADKDFDVVSLITRVDLLAYTR
jgi:predicted nucleic acid-binding protein